ncbi:hypothetical protein [Sphingomonas quercus]|uniref:Uncharacterized protein n=1 Tax=Sphingomonas quercus TaxID=2842451 RepID=A0ABS6BMC5_9SPHN|nr:hypothetical protein [Sphingomonas quercus]MBU3078399.1 hypothetical protein [Sphingomonas quercus]
MGVDIIPSDCAAGRHKPRGRPPADASGVTRGICRYCGISIMRTLATRSWYPSGLFGGRPDQASPSARS